MKITRLTLAAVLWIGLLTATPADVLTYYVATNGPGPSFTSWATAASNIQDAINVSAAGDIVLVSNGTYRVTNEITITNNVTVRSLSGWTNAIVYADWPTWTTRCFYVWRTGTVDGFTISNGHYMTSNDYSGGGGAYVTNAIIQNCYFVNNYCSNRGYASGGGGVYVHGRDYLSYDGRVTNCLFVSNVAYVSGSSSGGGGIYLRNGSAFGCTVISNYSHGDGGGICGTKSGDDRISLVSNCLISFNTAAGFVNYGGGGVKGEAITLTDCVISNNNNTGSYGGGVMTLGAVVKNCVIINNSALRGGGIYLNFVITCISNCVVTGNRSTGTGSDNSGGGGIAIGQIDSDLIIDSCRISNNICTAGVGGGGVLITNSGQIKNCLIINNTNTSAGGNGGGVFLGNATLRTNYAYGLINCTVVNNYSVNEGGGIATIGSNNYIANCVIASNRSSLGNYPNVYHQDNVDANMSNYYYCCAVTTDAYLLAASQGNTTNDPAFLDAAAGNYRLAVNSPGINTGTNFSWMTNTPDLDLLPRKAQTIVDMGAYESEYYFKLSPAGFTNTVMRGTATNFVLFLTNAISGTQIYWQAINTSGWVRLNNNGIINSNAPDAATSTNIAITNSALGLNPGTHYSRMALVPTNIPTAMSYYHQTGTVDMILRVAEFGCSVTTLTATVNQNGATTRPVSIWNTGSGDLPYSVSTNVSWLNVAPVSGVLTGQTTAATNALTVVFTNTPVPLGTYYGTLTFISGIDGSTLDINVELTVTTGPQMTVSPLILTGTVMMGQNPASQTTRVANGSSTVQLGYGVTKDQSWLTISPTSGAVAPQTTSNLVVSYQTSGLSTNSAGGPSNYNATITITATNSDAIGSPANVAVTLTVNPKSRLNLSPTLLTNIVTEGYDAPDCAFEIWNGNGYYTLNYAISDNVDWLLMSPSSGTSTGEHDTITVQFSTAGFTAGLGLSNAVITVVGRASDGTHLDNALSATQTVAVVLMIIPVAELATDASTTYEFSTRFGHPAGSTSFQVWNTKAGGGVLQYALATNVSWLTVRPVSGASAGEKDEIILTCNAGSLRPGKYSGALTISATDQATGIEAGNSPGNINVKLTIIGEKGFDFGGNGDGASDLIVYQEASGLWDIKNLLSGYATNVIFGGRGYVPVPGDFDGDMISDLGVYRYASGYWYVRKITDQHLVLLGGSYWAGPALASLGGYVSVAGDYDGDGLTDPAMYCELSGLWSAFFSGSGYAYISGTFGGPGYTAVPADYDGDGKTDPAVYNETMAQWYLLYSSDNYRIIAGIFGGPGFTAAPADYDGDGKADGCIYKELSGLWIILPSSTLSSGGYVPFTGVLGGTGFKPVPADYDGDGEADVCVYDEATGNWYIVALDGRRIAWPVQLGGYGFAPVKP